MSRHEEASIFDELKRIFFILFSYLFRAKGPISVLPFGPYTDPSKPQLLTFAV